MCCTDAPNQQTKILTEDYFPDSSEVVNGSGMCGLGPCFINYDDTELSTIYTCTVHLHENTAYKQQECKTVSAAWVVFSHCVGTRRVPT